MFDFDLGSTMSDFLKITLDELNVQEISDLVNSADCGAISVFIGICVKIPVNIYFLRGEDVLNVTNY